jgi:nucleotide-binding universal stress UspA family protein
MFRKILVPLDRTRFAEAALPPAMHFARRHHAALELATVWQPLPLMDSMTFTDTALRDKEREAQEADRFYMTEIARKIGEVVGSDVDVRYLIGQPAGEIVSRAAAGDIDLIVMSTHAHGPIMRALVGSVSDRLVRKGSVPLLLVRPSGDSPEVELIPSAPFRRVLVPLDGSALAESALDASLLACLEPGASEITLLNVSGYPGMGATAMAQAAAVIEPAARGLIEDGSGASVYLEDVAERIASTWRCRVTTKVLVSASTGASIVDFADANGNDLIAMAAHGRGGAVRMILGSIAETVVRTSPVPTMLFPAAFAQETWRAESEAGDSLIER